MTHDELKLVLEALEKCRTYHQQDWSSEETTKPEVKQAITAIKEALAQSEQEPLFKKIIDQHPGLAEELKALDEQEPVTWRNAAIRVGEDLCSVGPFGYYDMTAEQWLDWALSVVTVHAPPPAQRTWVGLTDEEIDKILRVYEQDYGWISFAKAIEAILKEKNT